MPLFRLVFLFFSFFFVFSSSKVDVYSTGTVYSMFFSAHLNLPSRLEAALGYLEYLIEQKLVPNSIFFLLYIIEGWLITCTLLYILLLF